MCARTVSRPCPARSLVASARHCLQRGFSLVEIAVVLVIVGLALGAGIAIFQSRVEQAQIETTRTRAEAVRQALVAYVARTYRMPCPAAPGIVSGAANYNVEMGAGVGGARTCTNGAGLVNNVGGVAPLGASRGTVPCTTLGLTEEACTDAWGGRFTYFVTNAAIQLTQDTVSGMQGTLTVHQIVPPAAATPTPGLAPTGNQINACSAVAGDNSCNLAAVAVVVSHGANRGGAFPPASAVAQATAGVVSNYELENTDNDVQFIQNEYVRAGANSFDDILMPVPARDVLSTLSQSNTLKDPRVLMNERFEAIKLAIIQQIYAPGFVAGTSPNKQITLPVENGAAAAYTFPATIDFTNCGAAPTTTQSLPLVGSPPSTTNVPALNGLTTDIWGRPIRYRRAITAAFGSTNSCVTPFVLISYGPDGVTGGATGGLDDIAFPVTQADISRAVIALGGW